MAEDTSPTLGVCYYPEHWPRDMWARDAARMRDLGITYVRIAEFAWSRIEPSRDAFDFEWLDQAIDTLGAAGLKVVMCTPTATPPRWLVDAMPDMIAFDIDGHPRKFGSRRHYSFSHEGYWQESARITEILAKRYGDNPHVAAWQTDNEYGCHDTTISYCDAARTGFRDWLAQRYQSPDALNRAWGNVFWSMEIDAFEQVDLPNLTATEANPAHWLDFRRYSSDQVVAFNRVQTNILRRHSPGRPLIHNFMGKVVDFDHFDVSADLDIASWDSYPIGFLEQFGKDAHWKAWYMRAGDPDFQAFHHDLYRACGAVRQKTGVEDGRWWVMEQQPGPVNWAPWNPDPHPGMARLWAHEAFAHGAEVVSYFRWRQPPFAQEQMHTALNRPDNSPDRAYGEAEQVAEDLKRLPQAKTVKSQVALIFDYTSLWAITTQPQGADYDGFTLALEMYSALRRLGQSIDIVSPTMDLAGYECVIVPQLVLGSQELVHRLSASRAQVLVGPRSFSRTRDHQIPANLPPGPLQSVLPFRMVRAESLRPGYRIPVSEGGACHRWFEHLEVGGSVRVIRKSQDDQPVHVCQDRIHYLAGWPDDELLMNIMRDLLVATNIPVLETGDDLRIRDRGKLRTIVNYGPRPVDASHLIAPTDRVLIGSATLPVAGVSVVERDRD